MSAPVSFDRIRALVVANATEEAIELLQSYLVVAGGHLHRECLGYAGRLAHLRQRARRGELSVEQEMVEHNRLRVALLEFVDMLAGLSRQKCGAADGNDVLASGEAFQRRHSASQSQTSATTGLPRPVEPVDILVVTVLPEEYTAVMRLMQDATPVQGTVNEPSLYGWRCGTVPRARGGAYRVLLALTGRAGNVTSSQAVVRSVERWRPRYVLLVGIAGGLPLEGCTVGDVVVSTEIYGYEYGKVDGGFLPRPNWVYQVDRGLLCSAQAFSAANPGWWTGTAPAPKVLFGSIASGDKVVDNPSEPFFVAVLKQWSKLQAVEMEGAGAAAAVDELRAVGQGAVGLLMVRGISDMPRSPTDRGGEVAQTGERDVNKTRACEVAAGFAVSWITSEWPVEPSVTRAPFGTRLM